MAKSHQENNQIIELFLYATHIAGGDEVVAAHDHATVAVHEHVPCLGVAVVLLARPIVAVRHWTSSPQLYLLDYTQCESFI